MTFRYIGSKARLTEQIASYIGPPTEGDFVDAFCGTGAVAEAASAQGWSVRINDNMQYATVMTAARMIANSQVRFANFGGYRNIIQTLNNLPLEAGYIWQTYSPGSSQFIGFERRYFTEENAQRIDSIRKEISKYAEQKLISKLEEQLLLADFLSSVNRIANIAGTYGCFLSKWTSQSQNSLSLVARELKEQPTEISLSSDDVFNLQVQPQDVVYLDPPYTKRQYASYYHLLETICIGDSPYVEGICGLRPWQDKASDFCYKTRALKSLVRLIKNLDARKILLSYSSEGHVPIGDLESELSKLGEFEMIPLGEIGRYRPNKQASNNADIVSEYLIVIEKANSKRIEKQILAELEA